jgi:hypothetical protein
LTLTDGARHVVPNSGENLKACKLSKKRKKIKHQFSVASGASSLLLSIFNISTYTIYSIKNKLSLP